jgi:hypothetical protein
MKLSPFFPLALWAAALLALMVLRPRASGGFFWFLVTAAIVLGGLHAWFTRVENRRFAQEFNAWELRLRSLVDVNDVNDDGHLYEWLDPSDWEKVFLELEKMPQGARNLRAAINSVAPDVLREDA